MNRMRVAKRLKIGTLRRGRRVLLSMESIPMFSSIFCSGHEAGIVESVEAAHRIPNGTPSSNVERFRDMSDEQFDRSRVLSTAGLVRAWGWGKRETYYNHG